jgi:hypothetical protein
MPIYIGPIFKDIYMIKSYNPLHGCMDGCMEGLHVWIVWMHGGIACMDCMDAWMHGCMDAWTAWMDGWIENQYFCIDFNCFNK